MASSMPLKIQTQAATCPYGCAPPLPKNLMKEGPEDVKRSPLEFVATAMKEE
jgi:hypothetical protein